MKYWIFSPHLDNYNEFFSSHKFKSFCRDMCRLNSHVNKSIRDLVEIINIHPYYLIEEKEINCFTVSDKKTKIIAGYIKFIK